MHNFFCPVMYINISRFWILCQIGTPKGQTPKVPLVPIPPIEEPFSRVAVDFLSFSTDRKKSPVISWLVWTMPHAIRKVFL